MLPVAPVSPVLPFGTTRFRVCVGAVPVIVAAAAPSVTVPIDSELAGPAGPVLPVAPVLPLGTTRLRVWFGAVPVIVAAAAHSVTVPLG